MAASHQHFAATFGFSTEVPLIDAEDLSESECQPPRPQRRPWRLALAAAASLAVVGLVVHVRGTKELSVVDGPSEFMQAVEVKAVPEASGLPSAVSQDIFCDEPIHPIPYGNWETKHWATNFEGWEECAAREQSPINIVEAVHVKGGMLQAKYGVNAETIALGNTGEHLEVVGNWGTLTLPELGMFTTKNIHWHRPSEHQINGYDFPMEMHIVNTLSVNATDNAPAVIAVIGILFEVGDKENACLKELFDVPCPIAGCARTLNDLDLGKCFARELSGGWYSYGGSLTTPPCTQGVYWHVMRRTAQITEDQLRHIKQRYHDNSRPTQPRHGRVVTAHAVE